MFAVLAAAPVSATLNFWFLSAYNSPAAAAALSAVSALPLASYNLVIYA